ncbi:hypothetical protein EC880221_1687, partial [Escherichia coli 88.0221]
MSGGKGTGKRTGHSDSRSADFRQLAVQLSQSPALLPGCRSSLTSAILQGPVIFTAHTGRPLDLR